MALGALSIGFFVHFHAGKLGTRGTTTRQEKFKIDAMGPVERIAEEHGHINEGLLRLARLIGLQMAREASERRPGEGVSYKKPARRGEPFHLIPLCQDLPLSIQTGPIAYETCVARPQKVTYVCNTCCKLGSFFLSSSRPRRPVRAWQLGVASSSLEQRE
jgi:hypothetical protein